MIRFLFLLTPFALLPLYGEQLDPQINVMNVGQVLDVRPTVSADKKYITFGGLRAGSSSLLRMRRADIITFQVLGLQAFHDGPEQMLVGAWQGQAISSNKKETSLWSMDIGAKKVEAQFFKEIKQLRLSAYNEKKQQLTMRGLYPVPGPQRKSAVTGQIKPPELQAVHLQGTFSGDLHTLSGAYIHGKERGAFQLEKSPLSLPKNIHGQWVAPVTIAHRQSPGPDPYQLTMTFDNGVFKKSIWAAAEECLCIPMRWLDERRELAMFVAFKMKAKDTYRSYGILNGRFSIDYKVFEALFYCPIYGSAQVQLQRK